MRIGHASSGNNIAGDQTGNEVCIRNYYNKPWEYILRAKNQKVAEAMATACEKGCANNCIGYSQANRNSLRSQASLANWDLARIKKDCDCDCSSFMTVCAECAGIAVPYFGSNAPTTRTIDTAFLSTGFFNKLTDVRQEILMRGDVLVAPGAHTVMVLDNGSAVEVKYPTIARGSRNEYVFAWQTYLSLLGYYRGEIDSIYGRQTELAVAEYQKDKGLPVTGSIDLDDWESVGK